MTVPAPTTSLPPDPGRRASAPLTELDEVRVTLTEVATADAPVAMTTRPGHDGVLFVAERAGRVVVIDHGRVRPRPLLEVATTTDGERGLLGLAFSPDGRHLYVSYTDLDGDSRLDELAMGDGATEIDLVSRRNVLRVEQPFDNHNGGHVAFGPDGLLYYALGDGGGVGDPEGNAQDVTDLLGSILRIDPRAQGGAPYGVPADNPFAAGGGRGEILVFGLRNPWRFSFDRATGDLWIADVGQGDVEEVDRLALGAARGANLGWPALEGTRTYSGTPPPHTVLPVYEYTHAEGASVTGGFVYRGRVIPGLVGAYVFGDLVTGRLWALAVDENGDVTGRVDLGAGVVEGTLVSFAEDGDGELYAISIAGSILRLDP
ncbi:MAG: PQQ-dependent sugar dehydrogenase [Actinobacteria bacterium]|nr:PQQ-dependent sugar dehydrogenase [Actinomycetota bacterium]